METTARSSAPLPDEPISLLAATDWNEEWKRLQRIRRKADDAQFWNKRSKNFDSKDTPSPYVRAFLNLIDVEPESRVLDMGCGTGSLAVPLAHAGNRVIAADFSRGMLEETARCLGLPRGTVATRQRRALELLRLELDEQSGEEG